MLKVDRYTFEVWRDSTLVHEHTLVVNPSDLSQSEPGRVNVIPTVGGVHVDDFGLGIVSTTLKGTTGFKPKLLGGDMVSGVDAFKDLRNKVYRYFLEPNGKKKDLTKVNYEMKYYKWDTSEFYVIQPTNFQLQQSSREPVLFRFDFSFVHLREIGVPVSVNTSSAVIPVSSLSVLNTSLVVNSDIVNCLLNYDKDTAVNKLALSSLEVVNPQSNPGLYNLVPTIRSIISFSESLSSCLQRYQDLGYLDVGKQVLDVNTQILLGIVEALSALPLVPIPMLKALREILYNFRLVVNSNYAFAW